MVCFFSLLPPEKIFLVVTLTLVSNCVTDYVTSATNTKLYTAKNTFSEMFRVWQFVLKYNEYRILESGLSRGSSIQRN